MLNIKVEKHMKDQSEAKSGNSENSTPVAAQ